MTKVLVVGAGFAGSVVARMLAEQGISVLVLDKRPHIGGNAYDEYDAHGVLIHRYGPHIFHTNSKGIFDFLSRFTEWTPYEHRVLSCVDDVLYPFPVNRTTLNMLFGTNLAESEVSAFLDSQRHSEITSPKNTEELVLSTLGKDLYELFYRNYTKKQWGMEPRELKTSVAARIPVRHNDDDRYFADTYQAMPKEGYTAMFRNMLDHENITVRTNTNYDFIAGQMIDVDHTFFTGPIDEFYGYRFGKLPYRSLRFEHSHHADVDSLQPVATVNYPNTFDYTRITEFKKLTGQEVSGTSIVKEFPTDEGDPYYPIPTEENEAAYRRYRALTDEETKVTFVGRLAQYKYYNMDQVVGAALVAANDYLKTKVNVCP